MKSWTSFPYGYDERQFCSPGFNLPVGCLMRTPHGRYPEYHTSADNLDFVQPTYLADSFSKCLTVVDVLENNKVYVNQNPKCEPQLGRRGLYTSIGGQTGEPNFRTRNAVGPEFFRRLSYPAGYCGQS